MATCTEQYNFLLSLPHMHKTGITHNLNQIRFLPSFCIQLGCLMFQSTGTVSSTSCIVNVQSRYLVSNGIYITRWHKSSIVQVQIILEGTACYTGLLLAPWEGLGLWPSLFSPWGIKRDFMLGFIFPFPIFCIQQVVVIVRAVELNDSTEESQYRTHLLK